MNFRRNIIALIFALLLLPEPIFARYASMKSGKTTAAKKSSTPSISYQLLSNQIYRYGMILHGGNGQCVVYGKGKPTLIFTKNKRNMLCNGKIIVLNFAPRFERDGVYISQIDWRKTLLPLLAPASVTNRGGRVICLDFGHGGIDKGASGRFSREKDITLRVGSRVAYLLRQRGYKVKLIRGDDRTVPLTTRAARAAKSASDIFVSIHVNSAPNRAISGVETYCMTPAGAPSSTSKKAVGTFYNGNRYDANNFALALAVQRGLLSSTGGEDHGVKRARFAVLRDLKMPGILVEIGFISNVAEERRLNSFAYCDKLARGIINGIENYQRGRW